MSIIIVVFCFKLKPAYEMRISDWSSDVCSSDLPPFDSSGEIRWSPVPEAVFAVATLPVDALLAPLNLGVMVSADPETLFAPLHRLQRLFGIVGLAMTAAVSGLCFWGGRRLTAPLRELEAAIRSVVDTKSFDHRAAIRGRDEEIGRAHV